MKNHLKIFLFLVFIILQQNLFAAYSEDNRRDGNWWLTLTRSSKLDYIVGYFDGMLLGKNFCVWGIDDSDKKNNCDYEAITSFSDYYKKYFLNVTNFQIVDGLDEFYSDYRNRRIEILGGIWLVVNGIAGTPKDKLDSMIESWRKNAIQ
jgi:hypothetical protein